MVTSKKRTQISLNDEVYKILEGISKEMESAVVAMLLVKEKNKQNAKK